MMPVVDSTASSTIGYLQLFVDFYQDPDVLHAPLPLGQPCLFTAVTSSADTPRHFRCEYVATTSPGLDSHEPLIQSASDLC